MNIELFIDGNKVDLPENIQIPMNYELEKIENPTIVKNNFSKTISLQGTPINNQIFGYYYELDKIYDGRGYNAIKRVPFELYRDNELIESGYLQLNNIKYKKGTYTFEITLYGGLGDFFYNLAYDEEGNEKTLADLYYGYGENDEDFIFRLNSEVVNNAWNNIYYSNNFIGSTINFIPSYNGLYEDFDSNKVLINTNEQSIFMDSFEDDNKTYTTIKGFGYGELSNDLTEWEIRDLRSYKQRPALRFKSFLKTICNPENNGGYEVELDEKYFFNKDNKYYEDAWIALPILNSESDAWQKTKTQLTITNPTSTLFFLSGNEISKNLEFNTLSTDVINEEGGNSTISIDCDFSVKFTASVTDDEILLVKGGSTPVWSAIAVWIEAVTDNITFAMSNCCVLTQGMYNGKENYVIPDISYFDGVTDFPKTTYTYKDGSFKRSDNNVFVYLDKDNKNTFRISIDNAPNYKNTVFKLKVVRWQSKSGFQSSYIENPFGGIDETKSTSPYLYLPDGSDYLPKNISISDIIYPDSVLSVNAKKSLQDAVITKDKLLKNEISPSSLLLSYTKMFGLYFVYPLNNQFYHLYPQY